MSTSATSRMPGLTLSVAWGTGPGTAASSWTDETAYLRRFTIRRGRQRELDRFEAGTATFTLNNRTRRFDPEYAAGALFGSLLPMRQIKLVANWNSVDYPLFYGYIDAIPQAYWYDDDSWVDLPCTDGFKLLALAALETPWVTEVGDQFGTGIYAWWRLGETYGDVMGDTSGYGNHGTYGAPLVGSEQSLIPYDTNDGSLLFDGIDDHGRKVGAVDSLGGSQLGLFLWLSATATPTAGTVQEIINSPSWWLTIDENGILHAPGVNSSIRVDDGHPHFIAISYNTSIWIDGVDRTAAASGTRSHIETDWCIGGGPKLPAVDGSGTTYNPFAGRIDDVGVTTSMSLAVASALYTAATAPWDGDTSGGRAGRILDAIAWPATLRDLDAGTSLLGPAQITNTKALDYLQLLAQTEAGLMFMTTDGKLRLVGRTNLQTETAYNTSNATFGDSTSELDYQDIQISYDDTLIYNSVRVTRQGGIVQQSDNTTSQTSYLARLLEMSGLLMKSDGEAKDRADWHVLHYKDPLLRIDGISVNPRKDTTNVYPQVLGRELGERITVKRRPMAGTVISKELHIEAITHTVDASAQSWETQWALSPVDPITNWAIAGAGGTSASQCGNCVVSY